LFCSLLHGLKALHDSLQLQLLLCEESGLLLQIMQMGQCILCRLLSLCNSILGTSFRVSSHGHAIESLSVKVFMFCCAQLDVEV